MTLPATYDGLAAWYEEEQARVAARPDAPLEQFADLLEPPRAAFVLEVGCGPGLSSLALARRGWRVIGVDLSFDQLALARPRCSSAVQGDGFRLPVRSASVPAVAMAFVHTDVGNFGALLVEMARVLQPGGRLVSLGVHPCFVGHHAASPNRSDVEVRLLPGYRESRYVRSSPQFGGGIRSRVGARHVPLAELLMAFVTAGLSFERIVELGDGVVPWMLAVVARKT